MKALIFSFTSLLLAGTLSAQTHWTDENCYDTSWYDASASTYTIGNAAQLADFKRRKHTNMAVDKHGRDVFLADTSYALALAQENFKEIRFHFTSEF